MSNLLNTELVEIIIEKPRLIRYMISIYRTIAEIRTKKPELVFAQNPSIVLAITVILSGRYYRHGVIIDAHNSGLIPVEGKFSLLTTLYMWINCKADIVLVTNHSLAEKVRKNRGAAFIFPDPIPKIQCQYHEKRPSIREGNNQYFTLVLICSWSDDEPIQEIFEAARMLEDNIMIWVTGNGADYLERNNPVMHGNIRATGFLNQEDYDALLCNADAVIVLTKREDCLVCGAYEAVSVNKPILLSATKTLQKHFYKGAVFTKNSPKEISKSIELLMCQIERLKQEVAVLRQELIKRSEKDRSELLQTIETLIIKD